MALYATWYNFASVNSAVRMSPAMAVGLETRLWDIGDIVKLIEDWESSSGHIMITRHPWFGPKNGIGWGWTPISWEGWTVTALCVAVIIGAYLAFGRTPMTTYVTLGAIAAIVLVCFLTGTPPG